jgi:Rhs element Vgr protein
MAANDTNNQAAHATPSFEIKVNGTVVPADYNLVSMVVYMAVNRLACARMIFLDGEPAKNDFPLSNKPDFLPGSKIEIAAGYKQDNQPLFKGMVVRHSIKLKDNKTSFLVVDCRHDAVKMTKVKKNKIFTDQKDSEIFSALLQPYGISGDADATDVKHAEMVQYQCSDWDFAVSRAEANSRLVICELDKLHLKKAALSAEAVMELKYGDNLLEMDAEMDARHQFETVATSGWNLADQKMLEAESSAPEGLTEQGNASTASLAAKTGDATLKLHNAAALNEAELRAWASGSQLKYTLSKIRGRAKCQGSEKLKPGVMVTLSGVGERFNGKTFIAAVRHEINQGNWHSDVEFGLQPGAFAAEFDINETPANGLLPAMNGLQVGLVTQLENDPQDEDRVLVKLPAVDEQAEGVWARQALADAGKERGLFIRPEVGDEVVLGFLNDDPRQPVVLGMLNSSAKPAVLKAKDTNHEKGFVSREKMKLWFNDEKKILEISTPAGNKFLMDEDAKQISIKDSHGNEITMSKDGIVIKSVKDIKFDAASGKVAASAKDFEANGSASAVVKGNSSAEFSSGGATKVKGGTVMIN